MGSYTYQRNETVTTSEESIELPANRSVIVTNAGSNNLKVSGDAAISANSRELLPQNSIVLPATTKVYLQAVGGNTTAYIQAKRQQKG